MSNIQSYINYIGDPRARRSIRSIYNSIEEDIAAVSYYPNPSGAQDYFVDLNVSASGNGKSWGKAFKTIAAAITASNTSIGLAGNRWWARRNRIFVLGDVITESLTVLPEKCDIIGLGTDLMPYPRVFGNHTIAVAKVGCRLINMGFVTTGTGDLWVIPADCHGFQMVGCYMQPGTTSTKAVEITDSAHVRFLNNRITVGAGSMSVIFGVGISIEGTAAIHDTVIQGNHITATAGIVVANGTLMGSLIADNYIRSTAKCINDASADCQVINNVMISDASADGSGNDNVMVVSTALAAGNRVTSSDHLNAPFPIQGTLA